MVIESRGLSEIPGILHGFGTRSEPIPRRFLPFWEKTKPRWHQTHGTMMAQVDRPTQDCGEADGLFGFSPAVHGVPIAVMTADCVPILMAHRSGKSVAAIHAGWRGTRAGIVRKFWEALVSSTTKSLDSGNLSDLRDPKDWIAAIGPAIGPCCYQVSEELATDFVRKFPGMPRETLLPGDRMLDLQAINAYELGSLGIHRINLIRKCTYCSRNANNEALFHSYRRRHLDLGNEGTQIGRQWSVVTIHS